MQVTFKTKTYDLASEPQGMPMNNGANLLKLIISGALSLDEIIEEATNCPKIEVKEDDQVLYVFDDYTIFQNITRSDDVIEVTVSQPSIVQQLINLKQLVKDQAETIRVQQEAILTLQQSQDNQDSNIEGLGDAIIEMSEIIYS